MGRSVGADSEPEERRSHLLREPALSSVPVTVPDDLVEYRALLVQMHEQRVETGRKPRGWNRLVDRMQTVHLRLREFPEGRAGITALAEADNCETARDWSAVHALFWDAERVRPLLESIAQGETLRALDAQTALRKFDGGRPNMTWVPKCG